MKAVEIVEALKGKKGQHVKAIWQRPCETLKAVQSIVAKRVEAWVRSGIDYSHLQEIKDAIERGEREEVESLPWGVWRVGYVNYVIDHNGKEYVRLYPASFDNLKEASVTWTIDGKPASKEEVLPLLTAKEKRESKGKCFCVNACHVLEMAGE